MTNIKIALVDNDYVVRAKTDLGLKGNDTKFRKFFKNISEELIPGKTAYLELEGFETDPITFEISKFE